MLRKEDEAQVDSCLLLPSYATNTTCAPQGGRSAGRLLSSRSEVHHENPTEWRANLPLGGLDAAQCSPKYKIQHALHKEDEAEVDSCLLLPSYAINTTCAPLGG